MNEPENVLTIEGILARVLRLGSIIAGVLLAIGLCAMPLTGSPFPRRLITAGLITLLLTPVLRVLVAAVVTAEGLRGCCGNWHDWRQRWTRRLCPRWPTRNRIKRAYVHRNIGSGAVRSGDRVNPQKVNQLLNLPDVLCQSGFHCRRHAESLVKPAKVVAHEVQRYSMTVILQFLAESVAEGSV